MNRIGAQSLQWEERLGQRLEDIRNQIGDQREKKGAKHKFKMVLDYAVRVCSALHVYFDDVEDLWELATEFASQTSGFPTEGNSGDMAMVFACNFEIVLDLVGWKVNEFLDGAEDNLSNGIHDIDLEVFGNWLQSQRLPKEQILADVEGFRENGLPQGRDIALAFMNSILRSVNTNFLDWFYNALMNEGRAVQMGDWLFKDPSHLVGHAVKHGTVMSMPSVQVPIA